MNPFTQASAAEFLLLYGALLVLLAMACRRWDPTAALPDCALPARADPYELAYLRGGADELFHVAVVRLYERDLLVRRLDGGLERRAGSQEDVPLSPIEVATYGWFDVPRSPGELRLKPLPVPLTQFAAEYERDLVERRLLVAGEREGMDWKLFAWPAALAVGAGGARLLIGLARGRPVGYLALMILAGLVLLGLACRRSRMTHLGRRYSKAAQRAVRTQRWSVFSQGEGIEPALLVGAFGLAGLEGTAHGDLRWSFKDQPPPPALHGGGGFDSPGGGDGGGGCGGCGGGCGG